MTTISKECARGLRVVELLRENIDTVLVSLLAAGERGIAGQLASLLGTTPFWEPGGREGVNAVRAASIRAGRAPAVADMRSTIRAELAKLGITRPEELADYFAWMTREGGQ